MFLFHKRSFKIKLFGVIAGVLSFNMLVILLFGTTAMETYYTYEKEKELKNYNNFIGDSFLSENNTELANIINDCEAANINILIFAKTGKSTFYPYYRSRNQSEQKTTLRLDPVFWFAQMESAGLFERLSAGSEPIIGNIFGEGINSIQLYSQLDDDFYLSLETPKDYIESTANTAVKFFLYSSLVTLIAGMIIAYFITERMAGPIRQIDRVAGKISSMDFSEKCSVKSKDELGQLSESINIMSEKLKENIGILKRDLEREEQTNNMRRDFMANVSHDFKTPLALISAYAEAIKDGKVPENEIDGYCDTILEQSATMSVFVTQLLLLSQLESGMAVFDMSFFCINDVVHSVIKNCRILLSKKDIKCDFTFEDEYIVKGDYNKIVQVFTNLFENAIKYVDENRDIRVRIGTGKAKNSVRVSVFNTGVPIPKEEAAHLFEQFYKRDKSRGVDSKSYGLGLAIVKSIIKTHDCECGLYNIDNGIVFWFELIKETL